MTPSGAAPLSARDPRLIGALLPYLESFNTRYFRVDVSGAEHIPREPAMFVGNHNGGIIGPDLFCTLALLWRALGPAHPLYALAHDFAMKQLRPLGWGLAKFGALPASRGNASRVLAERGQILVYPGGDLEAYRNFRRRNEIVLFPRTGFVRTAQEHDVPIVPIVAHGAHRSAYIFREGRRIARVLRMQHWARLERFPIALALPWGLALGPWLPYLPLPFRIQLRVLPPVHVARDADPEGATHHIQTKMQAALDEMTR